MEEDQQAGPTPDTVTEGLYSMHMSTPPPSYKAYNPGVSPAPQSAKTSAPTSANNSTPSFADFVDEHGRPIGQPLKRRPTLNQRVSSIARRLLRPLEERRRRAEETEQERREAERVREERLQRLISLGYGHTTAENLLDIDELVRRTHRRARAAGGAGRDRAADSSHRWVKIGYDADTETYHWFDAHAWKTVEERLEEGERKRAE